MIFVVLSSEVRVIKTVLAGAACILSKIVYLFKDILDHWDGSRAILQFGGGRRERFERTMR